VLERVHTGRHVGARRADDEVEVVAHRAAGVDAPAVTVGDDGDKLSELDVVEAGAKEILGTRRVRRDVVQPVGKGRSRRPRHLFPTVALASRRIHPCA
jgi:hypothetical protein